MKHTLRFVRIVVQLLPFVFAFLRDRKRWIVVGGPIRRAPGHHERRAEKLTSAVAGLGPTFIKLVQVLSSRADIVPEPYLSTIGTLHDHVPPESFEDIQAVVEAELGRPIDEAFDEFERESMAAASLGQVHRARVDQREAVVKVLRPGVEKLVGLDLDISFRILFWLNILFPNHHVEALTNVVREFSVRVREEMDFRKEAENMVRFRTLFHDTPGVTAPRVHHVLTRRRVLVMERLEGTKVNELDERFQSGELSFPEVMERLTSLYLRMMMVDGFLHADPHPGNILVDEDGTLVLLDWGMVVQIPRWTRQGILAVALAVEREELDGIINGMYQLGMISPEVSRGEVREAAAEILDILGRAQTTTEERVQEIIQELLDTFYTWPVTLPQELVYFFRAGALLEGVGFRYDPYFDGLTLIRGVIRKHRFEIMRETGKEPTRVARDMMEDVNHVMRSARDILYRAEREEFRVRVHPRDLQAQERFFHLQFRRLLLSIFATALALITAILFISLPSYWLLLGGLGTALLMFLLVFFIPTHLLENPLRHARGIRPHGDD